MIPCSDASRISRYSCVPLNSPWFQRLSTYGTKGSSLLLTGARERGAASGKLSTCR